MDQGRARILVVSHRDLAKMEATLLAAVQAFRHPIGKLTPLDACKLESLQKNLTTVRAQIKALPADAATDGHFWAAWPMQTPAN